MPKRNFKKLKASFRSFLETGVLGPINLELTLLEVAALLGPPDWWITNTHEHLPLYWGYGRLEINFRPKPPYSIMWFQIEHPTTLKTPRAKLGSLLKLSMDDIDVSVRPSQLLKELRSLENVEVGVSPDGDYIEIYNGNVCIIHVCRDDHFKIVGTKATRSDVESWLRRLDRYLSIDSVYSFPEPPRERQWPEAGWTTISAVEYLKIVANGKINV